MPDTTVKTTIIESGIQMSVVQIPIVVVVKHSVFQNLLTFNSKSYNSPEMNQLIRKI